MARVRIGTVTEFRDRFGLPDNAAAWEAIVSRPDLEAVQGENPDRPNEWTVYHLTGASTVCLGSGDGRHRWKDGACRRCGITR